jgi:hypothetical protein
MDRRFAHILDHRNPNFGDRPWSAIPEAILGFDLQNEGQAHQRVIHNRNWICDRARALKPKLAPGILVMTGGGAKFDDSAITEHFACPAIDVVNVHSYDGDFAQRLPGVLSTARQYGKRVFVQEFGASGSGKASSLRSQIQAIQNLGVPWMVWQVGARCLLVCARCHAVPDGARGLTDMSSRHIQQSALCQARHSGCRRARPQVNKPNNYNDFETYVDDAATWSVLSSAAKAALGVQQGAFSWPEVFAAGNRSSPAPPPRAVASPPQAAFQPPAANKCTKCNLPAAQGGCKCNSSCDCIGNLPTLALRVYSCQCTYPLGGCMQSVVLMVLKGAALSWQVPSPVPQLPPTSAPSATSPRRKAAASATPAATASVVSPVFHPWYIQCHLCSKDSLLLATAGIALHRHQTALNRTGC